MDGHAAVGDLGADGDVDARDAGADGVGAVRRRGAVVAVVAAGEAAEDRLDGV